MPGERQEKSNPKRKRGTYGSSEPRLRFGLPSVSHFLPVAGSLGAQRLGARLALTVCGRQWSFPVRRCVARSRKRCPRTRHRATLHTISPPAKITTSETAETGRGAASRQNSPTAVWRAVGVSLRVRTRKLTPPARQLPHDRKTATDKGMN